MCVLQGGSIIRLFHKELEAFVVAEGLFDDEISEDGRCSVVVTYLLTLPLVSGIHFLIQSPMIWTSLQQFSNPDLKHSSTIQGPISSCHLNCTCDSPNRPTDDVFLNLFTYLLTYCLCVWLVLLMLTLIICVVHSFRLFCCFTHATWWPKDVM